MSVDWREVDRWLVGESWVGSELSRHLDALCREIGPRWASSEGERRAVEYVVSRMTEYGLDHPRPEPFPLDTWTYRSSSASVVGANQSINVLPFQFCPPTDVTGRLVDAGYGNPYELNAVSGELAGAVAVLNLAIQPFTPPRTIAARLTDLATRGALAAVVIETKSGGRIEYHSPTDWREKAYAGHPLPTVATSREGGAVLRQLANEGHSLRLTVDSDLHQATGTNTVSEITGARWPNELLILGGHHDTVLGTPGGNDNASGTSVALETARVLAKLRREQGVAPGRTIRFATWSAEEQRLQGSYAHVAKHFSGDSSQPRPRFMINLDELATGTVKGVALVFPELRSFMQAQLDSMGGGYQCHVMAQMDPSSDHFPFGRRGIQSSILWRWRFFGKHPDSDFHHEAGDTADKVRPRELMEYVAFLTRLLLRLSNVAPSRWPDVQIAPAEVEARLEQEVAGPVRTA